MFGRKKLPVLTDTFCMSINLILQIAGVLTGIEARMKRFDFNTGRGQLNIGDKVEEFFFTCTGNNSFKTGDRYGFAFIEMPMSEDPRENYKAYAWHVVHLGELGLRIATEFTRRPHRWIHEDSSGKPLWWVGTSATNRWEEPYYQ